MESLRYTSIVEGLPAMIPFVAPERLERRSGRPLLVRMGANESVFGISPVARAAMREAVDSISLYNDPESHELAVALAEKHSVSPREIGISAGIDDLLGLVVRLFVEPGDPVVTSLGSYPTFNYHVNGYGGRLEQVPYNEDRADLDGLLARVMETGSRLVYLANPDNPMGTWHDEAALRAFIVDLPGDCVLIHDEAYIDFAPPEAVIEMDTTDRRVLRMRTFSKAHGMAGARVGYVVAHAELIGSLDKIRNHFGVNRVAQAGALASLGDESFIRQVVEQVAAGRRDYEVIAAETGLMTVPSATNFVCIDVGDGERARRVQQALLDRDIFVRMPAIAPQDRCIRATVGTPEQRTIFARVFRDVVAAT